MCRVPALIALGRITEGDVVTPERRAKRKLGMDESMKLVNRMIWRAYGPAGKWKRFLCGLFACMLVLGRAGGAVCAAKETEELRLYATGAVLMDGESGRVLYGRNADEPMAMASTTKIMTCILVLESVDGNEVAQVSSYAASQPQVKLNVRKGEEYRVEDLLYSLMLESHNDSAVVLAEHVGGKEQDSGDNIADAGSRTPEESKCAVGAFAEKMNEKAKELGLTQTFFVTPNGLDGAVEWTNEKGETIRKEHMTTATELARMMRYCILESPKAAEFLKITGTAHYSFSANCRFFSCSNHNAFLQMMEGMISGKTGFTNKAGYCYVGALKRDGKVLVVALLACGWPNHKTYKWSDTRTLMNYGLEKFEKRNITEGSREYYEKILKPIPVEGGRCENPEERAYVTPVVFEKPEENQCTEVLMREEEQVVRKCYLKQTLRAPVYAGSVVGKVDYCIGDEVWRQDLLVIEETVLREDFLWHLERLLETFLL